MFNKTEVYMNNFWKNKKVLVTGGSGFVGSFVVEQLLERGANIRISNFKNASLQNIDQVKNKIEIIEADLLDPDQAVAIGKDQEIIMNLAARVGGIEYNRLHPGIMFRDNILITSNMLDSAVKNNVERILIVSSACVYTRHCTIPTPEEEGFKDTPETTNDGYGWAKRMAEFQAIAYNREFGLKAAIARPYNCFGPRDHFDVKNGHVIAAIIKRIFDGEDPLTVWGTGKQSRAFLYVEDFARGLIEITEKYAVMDPVNLGSDEEIQIRDLVKLIVKLSGKNLKIQFDSSKPDGQPRRNGDYAKLREKIGFTPEYSLEEGLKKTIEYYKNEFSR